MKYDFDFKQLLLGGTAAFCISALTSPALAQEQAPTDQADEESVAEDEEREVIVVTGSRLRRDTFSSPSPLAVIDGEAAKLTGTLDPASILRQTTSVSGQQIDSAFSGFVTSGGPGAETVGLRNLGPERTLILVDGRRLGGAGTFGSAVFVDISLVPTFLINRAEVLLTGASSIYGADAVAGVFNIITPKDFEGLKVDANVSLPEVGAGEEQLYTIQYGAHGSRARIFFGGEYFEREVLRPIDTDFANEGEFDIEINPETGEERFTPTGPFDKIVAFTPFGFVQSTPGETNIGVPGFSSGPLTAPVFRNNFSAQNAHLFSPQTRYSAYTAAEYDIGTDYDLTAFGQALFSNRLTRTNGGDFQFFPAVPASNPFNPFGPTLLPLAVGPNGETCAELDAANQFDFCSVVPVAYDNSVRSRVAETEVQYQHYVAGIKGALPFLENPGGLPLRDWRFEAYGSYTRSHGVNEFDIIRNDRLTASLLAVEDPMTGEVTCTAPTFDLFSGSAPECVPVNLFSEGFLQNGELPEDARNYLVARTNNITQVEQIHISAIFDGTLFDLPAGSVPLAIGYEYRNDRINSDVDRNIEEANAWGRSAEGDTLGSAALHEVFAETEIPIFRGEKFAEDLTINGSVRYTDDEFFGSEVTWRVAGTYAPVSWLRFRGTRGTSFRAPNLRERFLAQQTAFANGFLDPCIAPAVDERSQTVIDNCISEGVDPFTLGASGAPSIRTVTGGNPGIQAETSDSYSVGFVFEQPWYDGFEFSFAFDFTNIEITNSVAEPSAGFILGECYQSTGLSDELCTRVTRSTVGAPDQRFLSLIDESFANLEVEDFREVAMSARYGQDFTIGGEEFYFSLDGDATRVLRSRAGLFAATADEEVGTIAVPRWRVLASSSIDWNNWSLIYDLDFRTGGQELELDPLDAEGFRDKEEIGKFHTHSLGIVYRGDDWRVNFTVENVLDADPELRDNDQFANTNNVPLGVYPSEALFGRTFVFGISKTF